MKLKKLDPVASLGPHGIPPHLEAEFLKHKHLGGFEDDAMNQVPFISRDSLRGKGGRKHHSQEDERYWAQFFDSEKSVDVAGGHGVPLSGEFVVTHPTHTHGRNGALCRVRASRTGAVWGL